jgi:hypothetical protein
MDRRKASSMNADGKQGMTGGQPRRYEGMANRNFLHGTPARELLLVKLAFWAVLSGFILLLAFILWGLATHGPSQSAFDSAPDPD